MLKSFSRPQPQALIMGILNVTPDSFSDGGKYLNLEAAVEQAQKLVSEGADIIDIGGESSRQGAEPISEAVEIERTLPVIEALHRKWPTLTISIDTTKYGVAKEALNAGATIINDISAGSDIRMLGLMDQFPEASIILMHRKGDAKTMQLNPVYEQGAVSEVKTFLNARVRAFTEAGISAQRLWVDPGIGFGKNLNHNLDLLRHLKEFSTLGGRLVIGTSRKSFLEQLLKTESLNMTEREPGTLASHLWAYQAGASVFRVHDVAPMRRALKTWEAILNGSL